MLAFTAAGLDVRLFGRQEIFELLAGQTKATYVSELRQNHLQTQKVHDHIAYEVKH